MDQKPDYKATLRLPTTDFPMKANLPVKEPELLAFWNDHDLYGKLAARNRGKTSFILHDGPPYANGSIHLGTSMNKILKDVVFKYRAMRGYDATYVPGWDCHGLPIELQVIKELGKRSRELTPAQFRQECRKYAERFVGVQREEFKRLGVCGDWEHPYLTMQPAYQAAIVREFKRVVDAGMVFRKKKPVFWCMYCETALAEAEVEYKDHTSPSIYAAFPFAKLPNFAKHGGDAKLTENLNALIWTTTPWTLVSNLAITLNAKFGYAIVESGGKKYLIAEKLVEQVMQANGVTDAKVLKVLPAKAFEGASATHPFLSRPSVILFGDHVTLEAGTGCVHTAPGHGQEDYEVGIANGLEVYAPVDGRGRFTPETGEPFAGKRVFEANADVIAILKERGALFGEGKITHSYPHCWRCKNPVIFRATEQWFIGMELHDLRKRSLAAIQKVNWIPKWGIERIKGMLEARPDWCISRQRTWGVPIVTFECRDCGEHLLDTKLIEKVAAAIEKDPNGADLWFEAPAEGQPDPLLTGGESCSKCKSKSLRRGRDILDVWFDSGVSYAAVLEQRLKIKLPCDLYLEGSDQHRGWFHSTLLEAMATRGVPPYKSVLTHGFVVDGAGKKMSKSLGNYINALDIVKSRGAELLRLWVAAEDYQNDVRISEEILLRVTEAYRRIRNTSRFLLGNLSDFDPKKHAVDYKKMPEIDRYILRRLALLTQQCLKAYDDYAFHQIYHAVHNFCVLDLSSFYLDVTKDNLYTNPVESLERRSAQTAVYYIVTTLARLLAPIMSFTAEEVWQHLPEHRGQAANSDKRGSVFIAGMPETTEAWSAAYNDTSLDAPWQQLMAVRTEVQKRLEEKRAAKQIGSSLEAAVELTAGGELGKLLERYRGELATILIVSQAELLPKAHAEAQAAETETLKGLSVRVKPAAGSKCERCWVMKTDVGGDPQHPTICKRCRTALA